MSKRKTQQEAYIDGKRVVGCIEAAKILTERAKSIGSMRTYSRDTIYRHYKNGDLKPAAETPAGNIYYVEDIEALSIDPDRGKKSKTQVSQNA